MPGKGSQIEKVGPLRGLKRKISSEAADAIWVEVFGMLAASNLVPRV